MISANDYIESWSKKLGLLPINLFQNQVNTDRQFILLNGQSNNFCIDFDNAFEPDQYKSYAWSSGVDSFLTIDKNNLLLYRWYKSSVETIPLSTVDKNIINFYEYLGNSKSEIENSIVFFTIRIFNKLRNLLGKEDGLEAVQAFLYLLASMDDEKVNLINWGLEKQSEEIAKGINQDEWQNLLLEFRNGLTSDNLHPNLGLILRHTAGRLFEEAHFAAYLNRQLTLFGPSDEVTYKTRTPQQYGAYFTPSYIARSIVEEILRSYIEYPRAITIFDPACGSSEFLVEILRQLRKDKYSGTIKIIGWDDAEIAIKMSKFILAYELREWSGNVVIDLQKYNSLSEEHTWPNEVDILLMNPPFRSWELMNSEPELREQVKTVLGLTYSKNPNQAAAFFKLAISSLKKRGKIGCLLPSALFSSDSHKELRMFASETISPLIIARLGSFIFDNALVDACMFVGEKEGLVNETRIIWTQNIANVTSKALRELRKLHSNPVRIVNSPNQYSIYNINQPLRDNESWMPVSYDAASLKLKVEDHVESGKLIRISNIFSVHRGADPGRKYFKISKEFYNGLEKIEKQYFRPCVESINIKNGKLEIANYLFFPKTEGLKPINSEEDLAETVPAFYSNFLNPHKAELKKRVVTHNHKWWDLQRHRTWQVKKFPKLVSAAFGKSGDFSIDATGEFVLEQSCAWLPVSEKFSLDILYAYLSIFCSKLFNDLLKSYSKQLAGGEWYNLQTKHVNNIPVPDFFNQESYNEYTKELSEIGKNIAKGNLTKRDELENIVKEIYNI